jgi:hypothetical protein
MYAAHVPDSALHGQMEVYPMREHEVETLAKAIASVNAQHDAYPEEGLSSFLSMRGNAYDGKLMVVGRSVNGWRTTWEPSSQPVGAEIGISEQTLKDVSGKNKCPMLWVTDIWDKNDSPTDNYRTNSSAFWRVIRRVVHKLDIADIDKETWPSHLVWSNLFKLSDSDEGNPSEALQRIQFETCVDLLSTELMTYKPKHVLMLTGLNWAKPFLDKLKIPWHKPSGSMYVEAVANFNGQSIVVAQHPQGKKEDPFVKEVILRFGELKG